MFYCANQKCPNHLTMPLYCFVCSDDEPSKHDHKVRVIAIKGDTSKSDWSTLRRKVIENLRSAKIFFENHGPLIEILTSHERIGNAKLINEHQELVTLNKSLEKYFADEIEQHLAKDEILELQNREPKYKEFASEFARLEYQGNITLRALWKHLWAAIP